MVGASSFFEVFRYEVVPGSDGGADSPRSGPLFATEDGELIRAVAQALSRRLEGDPAIAQILGLTDPSSDEHERRN
jgi:hypothetical protein